MFDSTIANQTYKVDLAVLAKLLGTSSRSVSHSDAQIYSNLQYYRCETLRLRRIQVTFLVSEPADVQWITQRRLTRTFRPLIVVEYLHQAQRIPLGFIKYDAGGANLRDSIFHSLHTVDITIITTTVCSLNHFSGMNNLRDIRWRRPCLLAKAYVVRQGSRRT